MFCGANPSSQVYLSPQQSLGLANVCLTSARTTKDPDVAQALCRDAGSVLSQIKRASSTTLASLESADIQRITATYSDLGDLQDSLGQSEKAQASYRNAEQWRRTQETGQPTQQKTTQPAAKGASFNAVGTATTVQLPQSPQAEQKKNDGIAHTTRQIFVENIQPSAIVCDLPGPDERLGSTLELANCLSLLQPPFTTNDTVDTATRNWIKATTENTDEHERFMTLATDVVREFKRDELKDVTVVTEVLYLVHVLDKDTFQNLLRDFFTRIDQSDLLVIHHLEGLAQLIQGAKPGYLDADDLVKTLKLLSTRLMDTHGQSPHYIYQLTATASHVLDAMADTNVSGLDRETLHEPLLSYLDKLKKESDSYLLYQAAYAHQALQYVPDNETIWQGALRRTGKVIQGVLGMASAVKGLDLNEFIDGLKNIEMAFSGASEAYQFVQSAYKEVTSLVQDGKEFTDSLKEGFSISRKREWYAALRGADVLIRAGQFVKLEKLFNEAPCRNDPAFQWGVCQRLGEIAANTTLDTGTRHSAVTFLGEIYKGDEKWGRQASIKQWIIRILFQISTLTGSVAQGAESLLQELETHGDEAKLKLYQLCREEGPGSHPLRFDTSPLTTSALLDRVQDKPDVEASLRQLKKRRINERGNVVYIPPQAKANLQAPDESRFPLMDKVDEFLSSDQTVLLLLGDSGAGKSTFNRALECELWQTYTKRTGIIPLYINLPSIDKPDQDLVTKQLRKLDFTEFQIRELKYRHFILICDGYDESQQTRNLYRSNQLNKEGEWTAKMIISCRSEYIGRDYRDRFEPVDRNRHADQRSPLFQEAVITPFSADQIHEYVEQYVILRRPLWETKNYLQALDLIPGLMDLVKNPFLLTMSLEVLPRMMDPGEHISAAHITKVALYDQFIEQWLERGKKRVGERPLSFQERSAFDSLSDEGFTMNGIDYLKKLSVAIYKEQGGQPVVEYSRFNDEGTWKAAFFSRNEEKQLLREACPLVRNGNQYRFVHRSLLEYGLARAVFEPQNKVKRATTGRSMSRRGSTSSSWSFEIEGGLVEVESEVDEQPPLDSESPLVWKSLVNEPSVIQFLSERVPQEPVFKDQLLAYVDHSKTDKKWRTAAANSITILVKAGVQFFGANLQGIQIPGADLSYGMFDSAQLQEADLRKVNLRGVWLRETNLSRSRVKGVQFGELPFLTLESQVHSCAYSPDGNTIAVSLASGDINVYTISNWELIRTLSGHGEHVRRVRFSPQGDHLVSGGSDITVRIWNAETGICQHVMHGHSDQINSVVYSPQGDLVASTSNDKTVRLWTVETGTSRQVLTGHSHYVKDVAFSPQGDQVASCSVDATARLWNVETGVCTHILRDHSKPVFEVSYSPHGDQLVSASVDKTIRLWDVQTGACRRVLVGHVNLIVCVAFSPKGDQLASGSYDHTVRLWDVETGSCRHVLNANDMVLRVQYSPKDSQIATVCGNYTVRLWDLSAGISSKASSDQPNALSRVKCSPKGDLVVSGSGEKIVQLWDVETGECRRNFRGHGKFVKSVAYSPQGHQIATASFDKTVRLWDVETGSCQHVLTGHSSWVCDVAYSPQGDVVASVSHDSTVRLWDAVTGESRGILEGHKKTVGCIEYSPNGRHIASAGEDLSIRIWNTDTRTCCNLLAGHANWIRDIAYSPQGHQIASASDDKTIRLWDAETGFFLRMFTGHEDTINAITYLVQKEDLLASCGKDKTVRLWDLASGQCRAVLPNFHVSFCGIASMATANGNYLVTGCVDGTMLKWQIVEEEGQLHMRLRWGTSVGALTVMGASIQGVVGLSSTNKQLLKQYGATGEL